MPAADREGDGLKARVQEELVGRLGAELKGELR